MNTHTPRDPSGQFQSWNAVVDHSHQDGYRTGYSGGYSEGSQYSGKDAALGVLAMALGAAVWEIGKKILGGDQD
jgi:hypothetical protein